jgi:hypothetical protein
MSSNDAGWIKVLNVNKDFYIDSLLKLGAYNNCTIEFPSIFFKHISDAENAIKEFYEPMITMALLVNI